MPVGLLLVTHKNIGKSLLDVSASMIGKQSSNIDYISVADNCDVDKVTRQAKKKLSAFDDDAGVLILTDVYGATPCNIANSIAKENNAVVVSGVNLPMLVRAINYSHLTLTEVAEKALNGGHHGIFRNAEADLDLANK